MFVACCEMGAISSSKNIKEISKLKELGLNLGLAFQIQDDFLDTYGEEEKFGKKIGGDILENKKTLLFIRAKQLLNSDDSENLTKLYSSKFTDDINKISEVRSLFEKCNIPEKISAEIENFTNISLKMLVVL